MFAFFKKLLGFPTPAEEAAAKKPAAPSKLDLNADGKVDVKDAVVAAKTVKAAAKGAVKGATSKAKNTVAKAKQPKAPAKPRAKKPAADKK